MGTVPIHFYLQHLKLYCLFIPFLLSAIPPDFLNEVSVFFFAYLRNFYFPPDICWRSFYGQILNNEKSAILIKHKFGS